MSEVSTSKLHERIPTTWLIHFEDFTNNELDSISRDAKVSPEVRAYASWEHQYREAARILYEVTEPELKSIERTIPGPNGPIPSPLNEIVKQRLKEKPLSVSPAAANRRMRT